MPTNRPTPEPLIGQIIQFVPSSYPPANFLPCDGRSLQVERYMPLYALIGNTYGGSGNDSFQLPNLPNEQGLQFLIAVSGIFPSRP